MISSRDTVDTMVTSGHFSFVFFFIVLFFCCCFFNQNVTLNFSSVTFYSKNQIEYCFQYLQSR